MRYKKLLENVSDWLWEVDKNGIYTDCSTSVQNFLGYEADEIIGKTPFDFMSEEEAIRVSLLFSTFISNKLPIKNLENKHLHKDGHEITVRTNAIPIFDEEDNISGYHGLDKDISREVLLKEELIDKNHSINNLTTLLENSDTIVFHWKAEENWPVEYVSKNISIFGYSTQDFTSGKVSYFSIIHPDDAEQVGQEVLEYTRDNTNHFSQIYRIITASGEVRWIDDRTVINRDSKGRVLSYLGTILDITKRKVAQLSLKDSEEKFRKIAENALMGIFIYKENFLYTNEAFSTITGYSKEELHTMPPWEILDSSHQQTAKKALEKRLQGVQFPADYQDMTIVTKNGKKRVIRISNQTIKYEGEHAGTGTIVDITDIIETKKQLQLLSQAIEQTDEMIKITDKNGLIIYVNDALVAHTGFKQVELIGSKSSIFKSGKQDHQFYQSMWKKILNGETYRGTIINKKRDSQLYYEEITISPILDSEKNIQNFVSTSQDITERIKMEEKLNKLATIDSLTKIYNRHKTNEIIDAEISRVQRYESSFSLAMLDIDHFKLINDTYGHEVGDTILKELTALIGSLIRISDSFGRWGGEEFILVLPHTNAEQSLILTNKLIEHIASYKFSHVDRVTMSIGVSLYIKPEDKATMLRRVDEALYKAKDNGRNRVIFK